MLDELISSENWHRTPRKPGAILLPSTFTTVYFIASRAQSPVDPQQKAGRTRPSRVSLASTAKKHATTGNWRQGKETFGDSGWEATSTAMYRQQRYKENKRCQQNEDRLKDYQQGTKYSSSVCRRPTKVYEEGGHKSLGDYITRNRE